MCAIIKTSKNPKLKMEVEFMCGIGMLPEGVKFNGIVVRDLFGHVLFTDFNSPNIDLSVMETNLQKAGAIIVEKIHGDKFFLKDRILTLNKEANLPGINNALLVA